MFVWQFPEAEVGEINISLHWLSLWIWQPISKQVRYVRWSQTGLGAAGGPIAFPSRLLAGATSSHCEVPWSLPYGSGCPVESPQLSLQSNEGIKRPIMSLRLPLLGWPEECSLHMSPQPTLHSASTADVPHLLRKA